MKTEITNLLHKQVVRKSGFNDYIALDFLDKDGKIIATPFYIKEGGSVEVHWGRPSSERCGNQTRYEDFWDRYEFKMKDGKLKVAWLNGPCFEPKYSELNPNELIDWQFQYSGKIITN